MAPRGTFRHHPLIRAPQEETGIAAMDEMEVPAERSALDDFMEQWEETLAQKDAEEQVAREDTLSQAKKELAEHMAQQEVQRQARYESNRSNEQVKLEQLEGGPEGSPWERVVGLIDTQVSEATAHVARMKSILIKVKNEPLETTRAATA